MTILALVMLFSIALVREALPLITRKQWRELLLSSSLYLAGFILSLLLALGIELPSVAKVIETVFNWFFGLFSK